MDRRAKTPKGKADPLPGKSPKNDGGAKVRDLEKRLAEALDRETATSEILRVIASSPTNALQSVMNVLAENAARLCDAVDAAIHRVEGNLLEIAANYVSIPGLAPLGVFPLAIDRTTVTGRAVVDGLPIHVYDLAEADPAEFPVGRESARRFGHRTTLAVPLLREGAAIGAILIRRREVRPFTDRQIALLQTFADQAVIAIENVRLFTELQTSNRDLTEALDQQTATAEILRVISSSPTNVQPVFDTIVQSAARLCHAANAGVFLTDGRTLDLPANYGSSSPEALATARAQYPRPLDLETTAGVAILTRSVIHVPDIEEPSAADVYTRRVGRLLGVRSMVAVPMLRKGEVVGAINLSRQEPGRFSDTEVELLKTFADQAVIAIENVRLFTELETRNHDLTTALDQQTATSEILRVISQSQTDVQPVFDAIVRSAVQLCHGLFGAVFRYDGHLVTLDAKHNVPQEGLEVLGRSFPAPPTSQSPVGRAVLSRAIVHIHDVLSDTELRTATRTTASAIGYRTIVSVPMLREGQPIGTINVARRDVQPFSGTEIDLLRTFADQAVIAIENVRLFTELQASNRELTTALDTQTATSDILRVISRSQTDVQPVFDAIVASAVRLLRAYTSVMTRIAGDQIELAALTSTDDAGDATLKALYPQSLHSEGAHAQAIRDCAPFNVADAHTDPRLPEAARLRARGYRSQVVVPMLRHDEAIGAIGVTRREPGGFSDDEIALLKTFADQAVIAIENARLLSELQARTAELTRSVDELTALGDVGRVLSSTLDLETVLQTIVTRANQLTGTAGCTIWEYDEALAEFRLRASHYADQADAALLQAPGRVTTIPKGQGVTTRVMEQRQPVQIPDITTARDYESPIRRPLVEAGHRALLGVPLLSEDEVIGVLAVTRKTPGEFEPEIVRLLSTFATQSALAIQNARLFLEIEDKSRQLEAASQHKSEFLANMSHELRTPLNAIIGFSEVLTDRMFGELNEKQDEYLKDIYASGQHLLSLINDILDLSKIEAGRMELEPTDFDLPAAIDNALTLVRERAGRRGIALGRAIDERVGTIRGDERKVKQVLLNLLSNALKFTPEGGRIDVRAAVSDGMVEVSVADTGVGIAPEDQETVFEEFRQVGTADKKVEGTGLGLALSRKFIELHGGRIWVKSQVGQGSTFTFTLPVRRGE